MRIALFVFFMVATASMPAQAWYEKSDDYTPLAEVVDLSKLKAVTFNVSDVLAKVVMLDNWEIQRRSETQMLAKLNDRCLMRIDIDMQQIVLQEIVTSCDFDRAWLTSIRKNFIRNSTYFRHVEIARDYLGEY